MSQDLIFKPDTHEYFWKGIKMPCVSDIVKPLSIDYSPIPANTLNHKRDLGKAFHEAISLYLKDDLNEESIDERLIKPMEAFKKFWTWHKEQNGLSRSPLCVEIPHYNEKLKYCGTPDLILEDIIYDWKLRPFDRVGDPLRMVAYEHLVSDFPPKKKIVVSFDLEGGCKPQETSNPQGWNMFRKLLERYYSELKFNKLCEKWKESEV